ncbi:hypothetical protein LEMA_P071810.1 [Plenodomus lingam JN3]|uniref:Peroxidase n=1 Tax=Leptosphaeria maculans (strain JN3 / isolate v23.1.3 / race Av1-4-5-6-7-8) TaxID=985895 RepID=E4ZK78_LEPMJ|nr:hypothetical protein LEMA_P071810.1 [Plenodomus lingam JN3]CBX91673.1 hypothetical protein LEMA_P071810.1 [Plenodomus lingam JN3]
MMHSHVLTVLILPLCASALHIWPRQSSNCPAVWKDIAERLKSDFAGCNPLSHAAIRAPFHDCINNGCDGSLILTSECTRSENAGLPQLCTHLLSLTNEFSVSAADTVQFAAAIAISSCPLGPRVRALVGRRSSDSAAAEGQIPGSRDAVEDILGAFRAKGISAGELVALLGTHSVAQQRFDDPSQAGQPLDSTPWVYDSVFYKETRSGQAPYSLSSDRRLSNYSETSEAWSTFADSISSWAAVFVPAWNKFSVIGNDVGSLQDCSYLVPQGQVFIGLTRQDIVAHAHHCHSEIGLIAPTPLFYVKTLLFRFLRGGVASNAESGNYYVGIYNALVPESGLPRSLGSDMYGTGHIHGLGLMQLCRSESDQL